MNRDKIIDTINKARKGILQYVEIMDLFPCVNVAVNSNFQRIYNSFYKIRQRNHYFYSTYYEYMENGKIRMPSFDDTIVHFHTILGRFEPSFSSKLAHTLDQNQPIWDVNILRNIDQRAPSYGTNDRLNKIIEVYRRLRQWYRKFLPTEEASEILTIFDKLIPDSHRISYVKKIEFVLWQTRSCNEFHC